MFCNFYRTLIFNFIKKIYKNNNNNHKTPLKIITIIIHRWMLACLYKYLPKIIRIKKEIVKSFHFYFLSVLNSSKSLLLLLFLKSEDITLSKYNT
jgi:hypothetical protein